MNKQKVKYIVLNRMMHKSQRFTFSLLIYKFNVIPIKTLKDFRGRGEQNKLTHMKNKSLRMAKNIFIKRE